LICSNGGKINFKEKGPSVCIVINGDLQINGTTFKKGESFFISCRGNDRPPLIFEGNFSLYAAVPSLT
jgi:mannose-6-phosphate isomerase class I